MPTTGKEEQIHPTAINMEYAHRHIINKSKTVIIDPAIQYMQRTIREQNTADKVKHTQKRTKAIAVIHNNIRLTHGTHPHIRVIKEVTNIHIAPIIEQMRHKVISRQFIIKRQTNVIIAM